MDISKHTGTRKVVATPQSEPIPGREQEQVLNSAGGFVFSADNWTRLQRFLILGTEGGTYYVGEKDLTKENHNNLLACIAAGPANEGGIKTVMLILDVSVNNRAPKNDFAIYALALCAAKGDLTTRKLAFDALPKVCRIGTHLFQFVEFYTAFKGWSRMARTGVSKWYTERSDSSLALQLVKYQQRNGWAHRDVLRLCHAKPKTLVQGAILKWAIDKTIDPTTGTHPLIATHEYMHNRTKMLPLHLPLASDLQYIKEHKLTAEMLPTELLKDASTWEAMLPHLGLTAILRNLARMTASGLLAPFSDALATLSDRLRDREALKAARIHPFAVMQALATYSQGHGERGSLTWVPVPRVLDLLEETLELSFALVEPTGKRILHALDVSGSMSAAIAGSTNISCRMAECVMALASMKSEPHTEVVAFDHQMRGLPFSYSTKLGEAMNLATHWTGGRTDCALPMQYALAQKWNLDAFVLWTDNETWTGAEHPIQALNRYRKEINPEARLIVCAMSASRFTIADPADPRTLDICGMDASVPQVIAQVVRL